MCLVGQHSLVDCLVLEPDIVLGEKTMNDQELSNGEQGTGSEPPTSQFDGISSALGHEC